MRPWLTRAAVLAVLHAAADTFIAYFRLGEPTQLTVPRGIALGLLVGAAVLWGALDGMHRKPDRGSTWLKAAIAGGWLAAVLGLIAKAVLLHQTGSDDIWPAITGGAAFTALLILIPAGLGLAVGGAIRSPRRSADADDEEDDEDEEPAPEAEDTEADETADETAEDSDAEDVKPSPTPRQGRHRRAKLTPPA